MLKNTIQRAFQHAIILAFLGISTNIPLNAQWRQQGGDIDGEAANDLSGSSVSFSSDGSTLAIGAEGNSDNGNAAGHVRVYQWNGRAWVQQGADIDGEAAGDRSGASVSLNSDGSTLAIGAVENDDNGGNAGHVRVYQWNGSAWVQQGADIDGEAANDRSGIAVSLSSDGSTLAIGALWNSNKAGHVRIYQWNGSAWVQQGADIDGEAVDDRSGVAVSLSSNGSIVAIGAVWNGPFTGHVRVYEWDGGAWVQRGTDINGEKGGDTSGSGLSLSSDGSTVAIGAVENDGNGENAGHVRVYQWNGSAWVRKGADIDGETAGDQSGISVSLSSDGSMVAIGANLNDGNGNKAGHVRVYQWNGSAWVQQGADIDGEAEDDQSGRTISLSSDGSMVAIGAQWNDGNGNAAGHVRVYTTNPVLPTVTTVAAASITTTSATLGGNVTADGGAAIVERGIVYAITSANNDPEIGGSGVTKVANASATTGIFSESITGLTTGIQYSFKTYATNSVGTSYGMAQPFITPSPTVTLSQSTTTVAEASGTNTITATLSAASSKDVTVMLGVKTGSTATLTDDFTLSANSIVINAGHLTGTATLTAVQDTQDEAPETITIEVTSVINGSETGTQEVTSNITDDDDPPTVTLTVGSASISEAAGTSGITATLSAVSGRDVTVTLDYTGTATNGIDYNNSASTGITITAGNLSANASTGITAIDDMVPEANETIIIDIIGVTNGSENGAQQQTVTITDDDIPSVQFNTTASNGAESVNTVNLQVDLSVASTLTVTVDYTVSGTAMAGTDYILAAGTLTFSPGDVNKNITIASIVDDAILETDETVVVTLSSPSNAILGTNKAHTYTINNNDNASVTIADISGNENDGAITVTAVLDNAVQGGFTVDVSTADGTATTADGDYTAVTGQTLTFTGTAGETQTFTVTPTGDSKLETNEHLTVSQSNLSGTTLGVIITDEATLTIANDDNASVTIADISGNENDGAITVTAVLDNAVQGGFTVDVSTADGTATTADGDYTAVTGQTLTFTGAAGETQTFTVTPTGDSKLETDEHLTVSQSNLSGTTLGVIITDGATITIDNDDNASVTIADISGNENDGAITVTAMLDNAVQGGFTVDVNTADGTATTADGDYTAVTGQTLTFTGAAGETQTFTVTPTGDSKLETDEHLTVSQSNLSGTTLGVIITDGATITIDNDDNASVTIADISGNENDGAITVTAMLDNAVQGGFTVDVSTADGTATTADGDYTAVTGQTLTFAGTSGEMQTFVVSPTADDKVETDEVLSVSLSSLGATALVIDISDGASVTITNDDNTPVVTAGQSFNIPENLTNASSVGTVIATDADAGTTFQSWMINSGNDDMDNDMIAPFTINASTGQITVSDSGDLDFERGTTGFTLSVTASDGVNTSVAETVLINVIDINDVIPVITVGQSFTIDENLANTTSVGIVAATDGDVTATTFNNWLITSGNDQGVFAINASTGEITIADNSHLDRENSADFTLTLTVGDGMNTSVGETVIINVNDVNDVSPVIADSQSFEVDENADNATVLGTIVASDMDVTATTFGNWTIVNGNDDNIFGIDAGSGQLSVIDHTLLNFEATASYTLGITVSDGINTSLVENVLINVTDANERPSISGLTNTTFDEDAQGAINFTVADPDTDLADLQFSFNIDHNTVFDASGITVSGNGSNRILTLTPKTNQFGVTILDVKVSDGVLSSTEQLTITVNAVNDVPTALSLSNQSIAEDVAVGFEVGTLTTTDADVGDTHTYSLVSGPGDTDNEAFTISGDALLTNTTLDFEDGETRTIRLKTTDASGDFIEQSFVITLEANPALELVIKTAFTPNGDGVNDTWIIDNIRLHPNARVSILNREGSEVFSSVGYKEAWDGTYKGKDLPQDTYYYIIDLNGNRKYKGFVTILK